MTDFDRYRERYEREQASVFATMELVVIGGDYGANGYTTRVQADRMGKMLALGPGSSLLDVGAGCGWPGLYLAQTTGCSVVVTDVPVEGLRRAVERIRVDGIDAQVVASSAEALPFVPASFDAIVHTDVLC